MPRVSSVCGSRSGPARAEGLHACPAGGYFFCSCKRSNQEKHALMSRRCLRHRSPAVETCSGSGATRRPCRVAPSREHPVRVTHCARLNNRRLKRGVHQKQQPLAARCAAFVGWGERSEPQQRPSNRWGSLCSPQPTELSSWLLTCSPLCRTEQRSLRRERVAWMATRGGYATGMSRWRRSGAGEQRRGVSRSETAAPGCAFFAYFLCTSKESKAPPARRANHQNEKAQSDSNNVNRRQS